MNSRSSSSGRSSKNAKEQVESESVEQTKKKKETKKEKPKKGGDVQEELDGTKQTKIDDMLNKVKETITESTSEMNVPITLKALMQVVQKLDEKVTNLASAEHIEELLNKRLETMETVVENHNKNMQESMNKIKNDISGEIKLEVDKVYESLRTVKANIKEAEKEIEAIKNRESDRHEVVDKIKEENINLKKRNERLNEKINQNNERIRYAEYRMNDMEQYQRINNIRIYGLEDTKKDETMEETATAVVKFLDKYLNLSITSSDIAVSHRMGKFVNDANRPVIVQFLYRGHKLAAISRRRQLKGKPYVIREDLTLKNAQLLEKVSGKDEVQNAWSDQGKIFVLLSNHKKIKVDQFTDLNRSLLWM